MRRSVGMIACRRAVDSQCRCCARRSGVAGRRGDGRRHEAFALQWYAQMQAGKFDRTQYTAAYGAQLTEEAVQAMSQHLNQYGASPLRAEIMKKRAIENQTFYLVKLIFPRGDATSLLFGFDAEARSPASVS